MCSSRKNPYPPHGKSLEIPRGRGVLKANQNFLGGGGVQNKNLPWGTYGYFLELHNRLTVFMLFGLHAWGTGMAQS